jgi:hypothetical protein
MTGKKKTVLIILGISLLFLLVPVGLSFLLRLPGVQNVIVHKAIDIVNKQIQGTIALSRIDIALPGSIVLENLCVRDSAQDTIVNASKARVRLDLIGLLRGKIHIRSLRLADCSVMIRREDGDQKLNIEYALSAKTTPDATSGGKKAGKAGGNKISLKARRIYLKNVRFLFDDRKSGVRVETRVGRLAVRMDRFNLEKPQFGFRNVELDSSYCAIRIFKKIAPGKPENAVHLPQISLKTLTVTNTRFTFDDTVAGNTIRVDAGWISLENSEADLNAGAISASSLFIKGAAVDLGLTAAKSKPEVMADTAPRRTPENRWRISAGRLDLRESRFDFDMVNTPWLKSGFDASHMHFRNIAVQAADAFYSARAIRANLALAAAQDSNTIDLKKCTVDFSMDEQGISAQNLSVKTKSSDIRASCRTGYSPFKESLDSLPILAMNAIFQPSLVSTHEILSFVPALATVPIFKGNDRAIRFSGKIGGPLKSLKGKKIRVSCGRATDLRADFTVGRLPDVKNMLFDISNLTLSTGREDVESLLGKGVLPQGLSVPSLVQLDATFTGTRHVFRSTFRIASDNGNVSAQAALDSIGRYTGAMTVDDLNPGLIYQKAKNIGRMTLSATIDGHGFDPKKLSANVSIDAPSVQLNNYTYHNIKLEAHADSQRYHGTLSVQDENIFLSLKGSVQTARDREEVQCVLDLQKADCTKLHLLKDNLAVSARLQADLKGRDLHTLSGRLGMTDIALVKNGTEYRLDSLQCVVATSPHKQTVGIHSAVLDAQYDGAMPIEKAFNELGRQVLRSLPVKQNTPDTSHTADLHDFTLAAKIYDHQLLSGLLLPKLTACEGATIRAEYSDENKKLSAVAEVRHGEYDGIVFSDVRTTVHANGNSLTCLLTAANISNAQAGISTVEVSGMSSKDQATLTISTKGKKQETALYTALSVKTSDSGIALAIDPARFYLGGYPWTVKKNNSVLIKGKRITIHDLALSRNQSSIAIASVNTADRDVISIDIRDFTLKFLSQMLSQDTSFVNGMLNGHIDVAREGERYSLKASAGLRDLAVKNVKIGSFALAAENPEKGNYRVTAELNGQGNDARIQGSFNAGSAKRELDFHADIKSLALQTIEPFTAGAVSNSRGFLQGTLECRGTQSRPIMNGKVFFKEASVKPAALNSTIRLGNEAVEIKNSGFYFNNFSIKDQQNHPVRVSGAITMDSAGLFLYDLKANADNFLLFNTTGRDNPVFYGRLIVNFRAAIRGTSDFPVIDSRVALKAPSSMTFVVPKTRTNTDRGENIVVFSGPDTSRAADKSTAGRQKSAGRFKGIELASVIKADKGVTLRLIPDPSTLDFLVVKGDAALNFGMDKSGTMSLTGTYSLSDGSYTVTMPPLIAKKFTISSGSTIMWNGNPADANAAISAHYAVSAPPIDLVVDQVSEEDRNRYRKPLKFEITLNLTGTFRKPDISFSLDLAPADKGAFGGMIEARLNQINQDPTALNKQVFALLVLGKFFPENSLEQSSGSDQLASVARSSVSGFLTAQLSQWGASILPGVELNLGVQSYGNDTSGQGAGKTMVDLGVRKQLFNDRLSVEVGGAIDVEGQKDNQNTAKDIGGNVAVEYKITRDGRYSIKGFRHTQNEDALEGQVTETGVGVVYSRSFNFWRQLFKRPEKHGKKNDE